MMPLALLNPGEQGEIIQIRAHGTSSSCCGSACGTCCGGREKGGVRMEDLGLRVGKMVEMLNKGTGPVLVKVDESRIAVDRGLAMKIMVLKAREIGR